MDIISSPVPMMENFPPPDPTPGAAADRIVSNPLPPLVDPCGRRITYLRVSVTDRCNQRCVYCMPAAGVRQKSPREILRYEQIAEVVRVAARMGVTKVRLTGGEPLVRRHLERLVALLAGVEGLKELAMTTNGTLLAPKAALLRRLGLDRLNISLDSLDPERYRQLTRGGDLRRALEGIAAARAAGFSPIKVNMVVLEEIREEEIDALRDFCRREGLELQLIRRYHLSDIRRRHPVATTRPPPCSACNRIRMTADGALKPCLFNGREFRLDFDRLEESFRETVRNKPEAGSCCLNRAMPQIGG